MTDETRRAIIDAWDATKRRYPTRAEYETAQRQRQRHEAEARLAERNECGPARQEAQL